MANRRRNDEEADRTVTLVDALAEIWSDRGADTPFLSERDALALAVSEQHAWRAERRTETRT
jgi:hypothetical protein